MNLGGFAGKILHVDLTTGVIEPLPLDASLAEYFGGGLGLCIKLAYDRIDPGCEPLSDKNVIVLGAGPAVGTDLPASSRVYAITKFPGSSRIGWCGAGGMLFGCMLKNAGYDHVIIEGRSPTPVYLEIVDNAVRLRDASGLWGRGIVDTVAALKAEAGPSAGVLSIGRAGENRVSFSMAYIDGIATLGRGGFGAVMGAKNLKALVVKGTRGIRVADRAQYRTLASVLFEKIRTYPYLKQWQDLGLMHSMPVVPPDQYNADRARRIACVSCPIGDKDIMRLPDGDCICSSSAVNLYMPLIHGFTDRHAAMRCTALLDDYGLDMFEFFGIMSFAKALQDVGVITPAMAPTPIDPSSPASMQAWAYQIATREGLGDVLAHGFTGMFRHFGEECRAYAPYTTKGMLTYVGPAGPLPWNLLGTMELGQLLDPRGPHVGASGSPTYFAKRELSVFPGHMRRMGIPEEALPRILPGLGTPDEDVRIGRFLKYSHQWFTILGTLGICARAQINRFYNADLCADIYQAVTGIPTDLAALRLRADRAWTLLRLMNVAAGDTRDPATIPEKWFTEPAFRHYMTNQPITPDDIEHMIDDYHDEQGWDIASGVPTPRWLKALGL